MRGASRRRDEGLEVAQSPSPHLSGRVPATADDWALNERLKEIDTLIRVGHACHSARSIPELLDAVDGLREHGVSVALDDFGTGFSSLALLRQMTVDTVKVDRSFVADALHAPADAVIVKSTIDMARAVGAKVVAEGVEDRETAAWLFEQGADLLQGYYFSRPIPADEVLAWRAPSV